MNHISPLFLWPADRPCRLRAANAARVMITLPWADGPLPHDPWLAHLLPRHDYNARLLARLEVAPPPAGCIIALFLADPLLDLENTLARLAQWHVAGIAAFPSISRFQQGFADALAQAGLTTAREAERLAHAGRAGFTTLATLWQGDGNCDAGTSPDHFLMPETVDGVPAGRASWTYPVVPSTRAAHGLFRCPARPTGVSAMAGSQPVAAHSVVERLARNPHFPRR